MASAMSRLFNRSCHWPNSALPRWIEENTLANGQQEDQKRGCTALLRTTGLAALIFVFSGSAHAGSADKNWCFSGYLGGNPGGGPLNDIENAMTVYGFDARSPGGFFGPGSDHPFSREEGTSWIVRAARYVKRPFSLGVLYGRTPSGHAVGYHLLAEGLLISCEADVLALLVSVSDRSLLYSLLQEELFELSVGLGPALYFTRAEEYAGSGNGPTNEGTKIGLLADIGLKFPANRMFFVGVDLQYRLVGTMEVGPFTAISTPPPLGPGGTAVLPETEVSFDHFFIGLGIGLRL
jgi:hypothetical protein